LLEGVKGCHGAIINQPEARSRPMLDPGQRRTPCRCA
jgi:hypothetical protein